ncbi:hypothetical protein ACX3VG_25230, partial [Escherichia coli]
VRRQRQMCIRDSGKGGHTFNTNLASHNKSVQDYLKVLKEKNAQ